MSYIVEFEPLNRIAGVKPKTVIFETAIEAWKVVENLMRCDERVEVSDDAFGWMDLKVQAEQEAASAQRS